MSATNADPAHATDRSWGVWYRPGGGRWILSGTAETYPSANALMFDLMNTKGSGDWWVGLLSDPPKGAARRK